MPARRKNKRLKPQVDKQTFKSLFKVIAIVMITCTVAFAIPYGLYRLYRHKVELGSFKPEHILISGNVRASDAEIIDAADLDREDINLVEINVRELKAAIETLPWVKTTHIDVELPNTINIRIEEHEPLGIVNQNQQLVVVDGDGAFIKMWAGSDDLMPPLVSTTYPIEDRPDIVREAFDIAKMARDMGYPHQIEEVHYEDATGYTMFTDSTEIRMGYDRFDERLERLIEVDRLLTQKNAGAVYILLDAETNLDKVIIKPKFKRLPPAAVPAEPIDEADAPSAG